MPLDILVTISHTPTGTVCYRYVRVECRYLWTVTVPLQFLSYERFKMSAISLSFYLLNGWLMFGWQINTKILIQAEVDKPDREVLLARGFSLLDKKSDSRQRNRDLLSLPGVRSEYLLCLVNLLPAAVIVMVDPTLTIRYSRPKEQKKNLKKIQGCFPWLMVRV